MEPVSTRMCGAGALQGTDGVGHPLAHVTKACPSGSLLVTLRTLHSRLSEAASVYDLKYFQGYLPIACCLPQFKILSCQIGTPMCIPVYK